MSKVLDKSLPELRSEINVLKGSIDEKPYSHNIIGLVLGQIHKIHGEEEAKKAIKDLGLKE